MFIRPKEVFVVHQKFYHFTKIRCWWREGGNLLYKPRLPIVNPTDVNELNLDLRKVLQLLV